jgi:hypothetical protein
MTDDYHHNDAPGPEPDPVPEVPSAPSTPSSERRDRYGDVITTEPARRGPGLGQVVVGGFLVLVGIGWFLEAADVADVPWRALLPSALILIGAALVVGARTARHGGVIALGVVLTIAVGTAGAVEVLTDIPFSGGIGEDRATVVGTIDDEYRHAIGQSTIDLRDGEVAASGQTVEISLAIGELIVIVPRNADLDIDARAGLGEVVVFGEEASGVGPDLEFRTPGAGDAVLTLDIDVAMGRVEVRR